MVCGCQSGMFRMMALTHKMLMSYARTDRPAARSGCCGADFVAGRPYAAADVSPSVANGFMSR
ncbi:hypothetical protein KSAC_16530 [Komagataeibacter saccharivorans]|nr:hypothetical protein KSAC_16530 [Komagataeibacter saccharivorans]